MRPSRLRLGMRGSGWHDPGSAAVRRRHAPLAVPRHDRPPNMIVIDQPGPVRAGDELDRRALETWLLGHVRDASGPLLVRQFHGGHANLNYLLDLGGRELVLRRAPPGAASRAEHDVGREYRLLASLQPVWGKVPVPLAFCPDPHVIGAPFLIARRVRGAILRRIPPEGWRPETYASLADSFADTLASLHRVDPQLAGLGDIGRPGTLAQQLEAWLRRYQAARTADSPDLGPIATWLRRRVPAAWTPALCHNDYKYDNLVLGAQAPEGIVAVLDWELASLADPQLDLAWTLACWVEADDPSELQAFGLTHLPGNPDRAALLARYARAAHRAIDDPVYLYVVGLLRLAAVLQQIYARHRRSDASDPRYARVIGLVHDVAGLAERAIRLDRLSALG
jgi:aminoglycoside phosphotransferase (APT) family kinase protein